jgi:hypothetical protein
VAFFLDLQKKEEEEDFTYDDVNNYVTTELESIFQS